MMTISRRQASDGGDGFTVKISEAGMGWPSIKVNAETLAEAHEAMRHYFEAAHAHEPLASCPFCRRHIKTRRSA